MEIWDFVESLCITLELKLYIYGDAVLLLLLVLRMSFCYIFGLVIFLYCFY